MNRLTRQLQGHAERTEMKKQLAYLTAFVALMGGSYVYNETYWDYIHHKNQSKADGQAGPAYNHQPSRLV